uniref:Uncharacterized protein n=1 Tax=Anguilla anguilla TaxID=7936 RepID=A0A0E9THG5_ANGAN
MLYFLAKALCNLVIWRQLVSAFASEK